MRPDLEKAFKDSKANMIGFKGSVKSLEKYLSDEEDILFATTGNVDLNPTDELIVDNLSIKGKEPTVLVITNKRILLYYKVMFNEKFEQFPVGEVREHSIARNSLVGSKLRVCTLTRTFDMDLKCKKDLIEKIDNVFQTIKKDSIACSGEAKDKPTDPQNDNEAIEKLEKLARLRDTGVISENEYNNKKEELLKRI